MFDIPDEIDCDACVLEWIWSGPNFQVRQCSDITVMSGEDATCLGTCLNGGMCKRGVCVCPSGYTGDNCQYSPGAIIKSFKKIFIIIGAIVLAVVLILVAVALLSWCADKRIKEGERDQVIFFIKSLQNLNNIFRDITLIKSTLNLTEMPPTNLLESINPLVI